jgi:transmembrane sensor
VNKKIVFNFFESKITSIQRKQLEEWLKDPQNQEQFYAWLNEYEGNNLQYEVSTEAKLKEIKMELEEIRPLVSAEEATGIRSRRILNYSWAAAALLVFCLGLLFINKIEGILPGEGSNYVTIENKNELKTIILPDQSSIVLQPNSTIKYSKLDFKEGLRVIHFEGDGFFEIKKDTLSPFIINTKYFNTKVLGTSFNLQTEGEHTENEIRVKTGKVAVYSTLINIDSTEAILLTANQQLKFSRAIKTPVALINIQSEPKPEGEYHLDFDDSPVTEVLETLAKTYNVIIDYDYERLKHCKITAKLSDEPLTEKVNLICLAINAQYELHNETILIKSYGCKN